MKLDNAKLLLNDAHGVYIPQLFARNFNMDDWHVSHDDVKFLDAIDHEWYWEAWQSVLDTAYFIHDDTGVKYCLYQDGDLWAVPEQDLMFDPDLDGECI